MNAFVFAVAALPFAVKLYRCHKQIKEHDEWEEEMYELAADIECGYYSPRMVERLKKLQANAEALTGEKYELPLAELFYA